MCSIVKDAVTGNRCICMHLPIRKRYVSFSLNIHNMQEQLANAQQQNCYRTQIRIKDIHDVIVVIESVNHFISVCIKKKGKERKKNASYNIKM